MLTRLRLSSSLLLICCFSAAVVFSQTSNDLTASDQYRRIGQFLRLRNYGEAIAESQKMIEQAPGFEHAYAKLVSAAKAGDKLIETKAWLESLLGRQSPNYAAYFGLALIAEQAKDYALAVDDYTRYLTYAPHSEQAMVNLVKAHLLAGRAAEVEPYLRSQSIAQPNNPVPHLGLGYYFMRAGKTEDAVREFDLALSLGVRTTDAYYFKMLARWYERRFDKVLELIEYYRPALDAETDQERIKANFGFIGSVYRDAGRYPEAIASLEKPGPSPRRLGIWQLKNTFLAKWEACGHGRTTTNKH